MPQLTFVFLFQPLKYLNEPERSDLEKHLLAAESPLHFEVSALRRKHLWAFAVPRGVFANNFNFVTFEDEMAARDRLVASAKPRGFRVRDIIERDGVVYYQRAVLERFRDLATAVSQRAFFIAVLACMDAAERDPAVVMGEPQRRPGLSPDQRRALFGHNVARGVAWSPEEDQVIRKWFGMRTIGDDAGKHVGLTPEMWATVLEELKGVRSKHAVQQRINALNRKLLNELLQRQQAHFGTRRSDGLRKSFVPEYMRRVLGERPRRPPMREHRGRRNDPTASREVETTLRFNDVPTERPNDVST
jgi:hypothetical protein